MYKFALEPVLNHRKSLEEVGQRELAAVERLAANENKKLKSCIRRKKALTKELCRKQEKKISVSEIMLYMGFIEKLSGQIDRQRDRVRAIEKEADLKREGLIEAVKKRKSLEKLDEKGWRAHRKSVLKDEQDFMNEVAVNRFIRTA